MVVLCLNLCNQYKYIWIFVYNFYNLQIAIWFDKNSAHFPYNKKRCCPPGRYAFTIDWIIFYFEHFICKMYWCLCAAISTAPKFHSNKIHPWKSIFINIWSTWLVVTTATMTAMATIRLCQTIWVHLKFKTDHYAQARVVFICGLLRYYPSLRHGPIQMLVSKLQDSSKMRCVRLSEHCGIHPNGNHYLCKKKERKILS